MSLDSPAAARADAFALLQAAITDVTVLDFEPFTAYEELTVTVWFDGYDPDFWNCLIRIYAPVLLGAQEAQKQLDVLMPRVEAALDSQWGPAAFDVAYLEETKSIVAAWTVQSGRE